MYSFTTSNASYNLQTKRHGTLEESSGSWSALLSCFLLVNGKPNSSWITDLTLFARRRWRMRRRITSRSSVCVVWIRLMQIWVDTKSEVSVSSRILILFLALSFGLASEEAMKWKMTIQGVAIIFVSVWCGWGRMIQIFGVYLYINSILLRLKNTHL